MTIQFELMRREFGLSTQSGIWLEGPAFAFFWQWGKLPMLNRQLAPVYTVEA